MGAELLGWELPDLFEKTILAMRSCEESVRSECFALTGVSPVEIPAWLPAILTLR